VRLSPILLPGIALSLRCAAPDCAAFFATDWRSATAEMRLLGIDDYLADLNVLVDQIGAPVDLIGLCQGGWMALLYAARFPAKVRKLVLAGAPVDIKAAPSALSELADISPLAVFQELVRLGDGIVPGSKVLKFWGVGSVIAEDMRDVLQTDEAIGSAGFTELEALFRNWYAWTIDLPGAYFLEVVEKLYKGNELAAGRFLALGQRIDLAKVSVPVFLLAARDDELVAPPQLFAVEHLVGTAPVDIASETVPGRHVGLFMGKSALEGVWPRIVGWLGEPTPTALHRVQARSIESVE
jgi:poly(3-hydroxyalkanoate) synthetase